MARIKTGDKVINSIRNRTMTPDDTSIFTDDDILDIVDEELTSQVLDKLVTLHGENLTYSMDIPRNNKGHYEIPYRAIGNKLRDISLVSGGTVFELSQVGIDELPDFSYAFDSNSYIDKFYVENNMIKLIQPSRSYDSIRMKYYLRPNYLTKEEKAGVISSIIDNDDGLITFTLSQVGKNFNSTSLYDIVGHKAPNKIKGFDLDPTTVTTGTTGSITFNKSDIEDMLSEITVGDYVTIAEETPVPNIPSEMHPLLEQAAAVQLLESLTDTEALTNAMRRLEKITKSVQELIDDRVELAPKKIKPRHGTLQQVIGGKRNTRGRYN